MYYEILDDIMGEINYVNGKEIENETKIGCFADFGVINSLL